MPFLIFLKSFEVLLYEVMSWLVFYPRTMWRAVRHPLQMMERTEDELKLAPAEQFRDVISPPIFLLLKVIAANSFEVAVVGNNALIDDGVGLAAMITDNSSLILFRLIVFASLPVVAGVLALAAMRRQVDRVTLQPVFYAQCFATTPVVLLCSIAATITRLPQRAANIPAAIIFAAAVLFFITVEASWFVHEARQRPLVGVLWALAGFAMSVLVVGGIVLLFAGL
jgi:hypothetical protein